MKWDECVERCRGYNTVIVTGCQRTGTTYTAKELSRVLGYHHYDEYDYRTHSIDKFNRILEQDPSPKVIQAPALLHKMGDMGHDVFVFMMVRDEDDVVNSMAKHGWFEREGLQEFNKFKEGTPKDGYELYRIKTSFGRGLNLPTMDYSELVKTEGYIEDRTGFTLKQTERS